MKNTRKVLEYIESETIAGIAKYKLLPSARIERASNILASRGHYERAFNLETSAKIEEVNYLTLQDAVCVED